MNCKVSVLLPCYNCASTLPRALDSLFQQTLDDFEVIAVDDGSKDETWSILKSYARLDERIRPFSIPHLGIVSALNHSIERSGGGILARMDADDVCHEDRLRQQVRLLENEPDLGLVGCRVDFAGDRDKSPGYAGYVDWINGLIDHFQIQIHRFVDCPIGHPTFVFRRKCLEELGGYRQGDFPEDYELLLRWLRGGVKMAKTKKSLLHWQDSKDRLSRTSQRYSPEAFFWLKIGYLIDWLKENNPFFPEVFILGYSKKIRSKAAYLEKQGLQITAFVDAARDKQGLSPEGVPIVPQSRQPDPGKGFGLSLLGNWSNKASLLAYMSKQGYRLGKDFVLAA